MLGTERVPLVRFQYTQKVLCSGKRVSESLTKDRKILHVNLITLVHRQKIDMLASPSMATPRNYSSNFVPVAARNEVQNSLVG